ncbi:hypothetical protein A2914_00520 [Candidatus Nomurabacteria bacterium RIFCSPLOWO2_01_FULL_41_21]|uniref:Uncharacterized protein n=2 Tax=Candidatus Nomuraibacteriota TaxID=1752729 RepID=A0A1F6V3Z5_9BACT|nr:MAG: hypothetical protein A2733_02880 [Candidatus Nomurabacteria bacterium RIFCSPHIGHO2_01_FULL_40_20]OGI88326.1 MAG: hypothetical protein A2914_00520 [Candidatus Nomurabacteria bacterium RIFCSPLOWO2_01_FULL_41_21]
MINLIPIEEKQKMTRAFYLRLTVVSLLVLGCSMLVAGVALLPSYFFVKVKQNLVLSKLEEQKAETLSSLELEAVTLTGKLNAKLNLVESSSQNKYIVSQKVINEILLKKIPEIKITRISYSSSQEGRKIQISGTAPSRDKLLSFNNALSNDPAFKQVDLPVSNFVKGSNISFFMTIIPN